MPLVQTRGAASAQGFGEFAQATVANYIEDVFSTYLYTGNGTTQTITNGIDLAGEGGLVWDKSRTVNRAAQLIDSARGVNKVLNPNNVDPQQTIASTISSFDSTGFTLGAGDGNNPGESYVAWTWRKQPKFFDVVTYTGTGSNTTIAHSLGSVPGSIIVKRTNAGAAWAVYHRSLANTQYLVLNSTAAAATGATWWNSTTPTSAVFSLGTDASVNASGSDYVAYLFAHDAGGFGLTGTDNVISCGSFTTDGSGNATVNLGYEPQFLIHKATTGTESWLMLDTMRGWNMSTADRDLFCNSASAEASGNYGDPTATGFTAAGLSATRTYIYIAIRRGPMKVPTLGTSVFSPNTATYSANQVVTTGFPVDMLMMKGRTITFGNLVYDRLRGLASTNTSPVDPQLLTSDTSAETSGDYVNTVNNTGYQISPGFSGFSSVNWNFRRAPGFFDVVCYTGTGSALNPTHSLGVTPELKIIKSRSGSVAWIVGGSVIGGGVNFYMFLETNAIVESTNYWSSGSDSATTFSTRAGNSTSNSSGQTYVAYLFATCAGVSKVFSYTGNGSSQTINCGFTGGARFVLIKRTDSTGDWYVWDSARGIVAGNDPHLSLNTTAAEVTTDDSVDTDNTGFIVNQVAATNVNVSSATYIGLAIA